MSLSTLELSLRAATVALLLVLAASLWRDFRHVAAGRLTIALALGTIAHAVTNEIGSTAPVSLWHAPLIALSTGDAVVVWLFTRALLDDAFVPRWWHALIWAAVSAYSFISCLWIAPAVHGRPAIIAVNLLALCFIALALVQTITSWSADLVERRRHVRVFMVGAAVLYGGVNALLGISVWGRDTAAVANVVNAAVLTGIVAAICYTMMRVNAADLFPAPSTASTGAAEPLIAAADSGADQKLIDALMRLMADERIYRHDNITIGALATKLSIPEYRLRRLINQRLGYRNFNVFLNNHRIEEAKAALADPSQAEVPVITIAMDAGFQSLGPFNRAFKAVTGVTPTEYRRLKADAA
ncbi:helix-turn-helix domain-containing protein [Bradyrhizobium sp. CB2312]|uniref:AraC family transcriptional regulator n=1 Tax=Bradyrhizobium sp. CB2312 TaxID=3039155 RepID=UPI0024B0CFEA|nr:helix-turn-helix domain-containing protein [Bradyrhizobium sp. CB2312]WFU72522.1 helix-turn-helix domain-containing protein [Bradyrhizobium sp. CB2312]